jgi:hypothetical protein
MRPGCAGLLTTRNRSLGPAGMDLPGYRLHQLKSRRARQWAVFKRGDAFQFYAGDIKVEGRHP